MDKTANGIVVTNRRNDEISRTGNKAIGGIKVDYPMYFQYYVELLTAMAKNIENNAFRGSDRGGEYSCWNGKHSIPLYENNIFAVIGDRGTGKTTAISEFSHILEDYGGSEGWQEEISFRSGGKKQYCFHVLPLIDASVLNTKEDLVEVILASMYQRANKKQGNSKQEDFDKREGQFRKIIARFDSAYKDYLNVGKHESREDLGNSVLIKLRNASDSLKTKMKFAELAEVFLELLDDGREVKNNSYLVIIVDDLDMNPGSGFQMLDQLYKYFSNRRVIVLIAIKYAQMYSLSVKNFVDGLIPEYGGTHCKVYEKKEQEARRLANDYLLKALPLNNRVYLPEGSKFYGETEVRQGEQAEKLPVKKFLFKKMVQKMNIYYDSEGLKKHFCLPDTMRELVSYTCFLDSLLSLEEIERQDPGKQLALYDQNHERFNNDLEYRMAMKLLSDDQLELYQLIMARHVERRAGYMLCFVRNWMENKADGIEEKMYLVDSVDEMDFCYTDLMGALFQLGRMDYEDKVLVHCIMASFTSEMVREYYSYRHSNGDVRKSAEKSLKSFLGMTFGGKWLKEAMPNIVMDMGLYKANLEACYIGNVSVEHLEIEIEQVVGQQKTEEWLAELLLENFPYVECISLLFVNAKDENGRLVLPAWEFVIDKRDTEEGEKAVLTVKGQVYSASFDMFGFLGREVRAEAPMHDETLLQKLKKCAAAYCDKYGEADVKGKVLTQLTVQAEKRTIWKGAQNTLGFPYYDFDMAYNVVKRVRRKMAESESVPAERICEYYRTIYGYMAYYLYKEDVFYKELFGKKEGEGVPNLHQNFIDVPFIKAFGFQSEEKEIQQAGEENGKMLDREKMNKYLLGVIKSLSVNVVRDKDENMME